MILVADGGSTKTDWSLIGPDEKVLSFQTSGMNPLFAGEEDVIRELSGSPVAEHVAAISDVYFYGAGLATTKLMEKLSSFMGKFFPAHVQTHMHDDLTAAALALFQGKDGIACILGTGSNSCLYLHGRIADKVPALGYTLGDEGSGANLGRRFINALFKRQFSQDLTDTICREHQIDASTVIQKVYGEAYPNKYLASLTRIIIDYIDHFEIRAMVADAFEEFISNNIRHYKQHESLEIGFVGSVAFHFREILSDTLRRNRLRAGPIIKAPIAQLTEYHLKSTS